MPVNRFTIGLMYVLTVLPLLLFSGTWLRGHRHISKELLLPTVSALLLLLAVERHLKVLLLGPDYANRLYITIWVNLLVAIVSTVYFGMKRKWIALLAALILALDWGIMGAINSVVRWMIGENPHYTQNPLCPSRRITHGYNGSRLITVLPA